MKPAPTNLVEPVITRTINADISLTEAQWKKFFHELHVRHICCEAGIDSPQPSDFVMFQIFKSMLQSPPEKSAHPKRPLLESART